MDMQLLFLEMLAQLITAPVVSVRGCCCGHATEIALRPGLTDDRRKVLAVFKTD